MWRFLLKLWIKLKCFKYRNITKIDIAKQVAFLNIIDITEWDWKKLKTSIKYKPDKLFGFIPWDKQLEPTDLIKNKEGDCNSIHRLAQLLLLVNSSCDIVYLVSYITKPIKHSHTFCVGVINSKYIAYDYSYQSKGFYNMEDCIKHLIELRKRKVRAIIVQDEYYKIVKEF